MNEAIIEGNCGQLCDYHCCRSHEEDEDLGMYLLPLEYEAIQKNRGVDFEVHSSYDYEIYGAKKLFYIFCNNNSGCLREFRPVQCRTYPLEPHMEDGKLMMIIENDQFHKCPLIDNRAIWRKEFIKGIYAGWALLLTLEPVLRHIEVVSRKRKGYYAYVKPVD